jgi:CRISPR/Cas system-associated endoribonuclease Cas2
MGRKSIAQNIIDEVIDESEDTNWVVCYDFRDDQPVGRFYPNLKEIRNALGGEMIQYSVFYGPMRASVAVKKLAEYYGAMVSRFLIDERFRIDP